MAVNFSHFHLKIRFFSGLQDIENIECFCTLLQGTGKLVWKHDIKDPITSSAYIDENIQVASDSSHLSERYLISIKWSENQKRRYVPSYLLFVHCISRLICVCGSSGSIHVLKIMLKDDEKTNQQCKYVVQDFARLDLQGDIFSSPVMIGGRIFVGCRDDSVHCIGI